MLTNKPIAQPFQEFVCEEILPSIRKAGEYKYQKILDEKNKLEQVNKDLHRLVKRKERKKYKKGSCVYIVQNPDIKNKYKIGETSDINRRIQDYGPGAPSSYEAIYHRMVPTIVNQKSIEDLLLTILDPYRVKEESKFCKKREWVENVDLKTIQTELDGLVDYINERRKLHDPDCNLYDSSESESDNVFTIQENEEPKKLCLKCDESKILGAFYKRSDNVDGLESLCKTCYSERQKIVKQKRDYIEPRTDGIKKCFTCNEDRSLELFQKHNTSKDGRIATCSICKQLPEPSNIKEKKCSHCKETKEFVEYNKCRTSVDGYSYYCRLCSKIKCKEYKDKRKQEGACISDIVEKTCKSCQETKIIDTNFWKHPSSKDGLQSTCIKCYYKKRKDRKTRSTV